jgi:hypothetical protein
MGVGRRRLPVHGTQVHPESVLTLRGHDLLANFLGFAVGAVPGVQRPRALACPGYVA